MADSMRASGVGPPEDMVTALTIMANNMVGRQVELMQELMSCADPAAMVAATTTWTERTITSFMNDQARVVEATTAQMERFVRIPPQ